MGFFAAGGPFVETMYADPQPGEEDDTVVRRLVSMIEDTPVGGAIHASIFRLDLPYVREALVAANNRGTAVHVVHNGRDKGDPEAALLARPAPGGLGARHRWTGKGYDPTGAAPDYGAIATGPDSDMHSKLFLFSATKDPGGVQREHVSWWGSGNLSRHSGTQKSNNAVAVYQDATLYLGFKLKLWDLMWRQAHFPRNDFYNVRLARGTFMGGPPLRCKVFCSPEQDSDLWVNRLRSLVVDESTRVDVAQGRFHDSRMPVARRLVAIHRAGGAVRVVAGSDPGFLGPNVARTLLEAGIPVRTTNTHDKLALVHSRHGVSRAPRKLVLNGSHNLTRIANYGNDELLVKMFNDEVYDEMLAEHYEHLWARAEPVSP
jgi:hypothetical protein